MKRIALYYLFLQTALLLSAQQSIKVSSHQAMLHIISVFFDLNNINLSNATVNYYDKLTTTELNNNCIVNFVFKDYPAINISILFPFSPLSGYYTSLDCIISFSKASKQVSIQFKNDTMRQAFEDLKTCLK